MASTKQSWARGGTIFAATLMVLIGVYQFFVGLAAVVQDNFFVVGPNYTYEIDTTAWGWIHMGIGVLAAVSGFFLYTGATWARAIAIAMAAISAIANFFFVPYYPIWSLLIIALDIFAIWAVATVRPADMTGESMEAMGAGAAYGTRGEYAQTGERWPAGNVPPATAQTSGRHWAPEDVKTPEDARAAEARERSEAAARGAHGTGTYTAGSGGVSPPTTPPTGNPPTNPPA